MSSALSKIWAVVAADFLIRFRRASTLAAFVALCLSAYIFVPDPATGWTLMAMDGGRRALYNSAAIATGTACLYSALLSLFGFYIVSNAIGRDVVSRAGAVIASTRVRNWHYLIGKFVGNLGSLLTLSAGLAASAMIMHLIRGEASLQPWLYLEYYALLVVPAVVLTSAVAIAFESTSILSGKLGDLVYFFLWTSLSGIVALAALNRRPSLLFGLPLATYLDPTGLIIIIRQTTQALGTDHFSIGQTDYDVHKAPFVFQGLRFAWPEILSRVTSAALPLILLLFPALYFHRFDPGVLRSGARKHGRNWFQALNRSLKFVVRLADHLISRATALRGPSFMASVSADVWLTANLYPLGFLCAGGLALAALFVPAALVSRLILPLQFPILALLLSDFACRESRSGTAELVFAAPRLRSRFVLWKMAGSLTLIYGLTALPMARVAIEGRIQNLLSLLLGGAFVAAWATCLAVVSLNPKAFIACSLLLWYLTFSDAGRNPALDFAGWHGKAGWTILAAYLAVGTLFLGTAEIAHRFRLRR